MQNVTGMLDPDLQESFIGYAEIKKVFSVSKIGKIAGCVVTEGIVKKGCSFVCLEIIGNSSGYVKNSKKV